MLKDTKGRTEPSGPWIPSLSAASSIFLITVRRSLSETPIRTFGKRSFEKNALVENAKAVVDALNSARPASAKGTYIKRCTISSTMGPGLRVALKEIVN